MKILSRIREKRQEAQRIREMQAQAQQAVLEDPGKLFETQIAPIIPNHFKLFRHGKLSANDLMQQSSQSKVESLMANIAPLESVPASDKAHAEVLANVLMAGMVAGMVDGTLITIGNTLPLLPVIPGTPEQKLQEVFNRMVSEFKEKTLPQGKEALKKASKSHRAEMGLGAAANGMIVPMAKELPLDQKEALAKYKTNLLICALGAYGMVLAETALKALDETTSQATPASSQTP